MARGMSSARKDRLERTLDQVSCPVLVVRGRHDAICDESWARTVADVAPRGSRAVTLPVGAHMVPSTHGPLVAAEGWLYDDRHTAWTRMTRPEGAPETPGPAVWAGKRLVVYGGADWGRDTTHEGTPEDVWSTGVWAYLAD